MLVSTKRLDFNSTSTPSAVQATAGGCFIARFCINRRSKIARLVEMGLIRLSPPFAPRNQPRNVSGWGGIRTLAEFLEENAKSSRPRCEKRSDFEGFAPDRRSATGRHRRLAPPARGAESGHPGNRQDERLGVLILPIGQRR